MEPHQLRVVLEQQDLTEKIGKLIAFISSTNFGKIDKAEQNRLILQTSVMSTYELILKDRIEAF